MAAKQGKAALPSPLLPQPLSEERRGDKSLYWNCPPALKQERLKNEYHGMIGC